MILVKIRKEKENSTGNLIDFRMVGMIWDHF